MKKTIIAFAIAFVTLTVTNAQSTAVEPSTKELKAAVQDDYTEVEVSELPQAVKDAIAKDLKDVVVSKAFVNKKGEFKLVVTTDDELSKTLYANNKGEWIKKQ